MHLLHQLEQRQCKYWDYSVLSYTDKLWSIQSASLKLNLLCDALPKHWHGSWTELFSRAMVICSGFIMCFCGQEGSCCFPLWITGSEDGLQSLGVHLKTLCAKGQSSNYSLAIWKWNQLYRLSLISSVMTIVGYVRRFLNQQLKLLLTSSGTFCIMLLSCVEMVDRKTEEEKWQTT